MKRPASDGGGATLARAKRATRGAQSFAGAAAASGPSDERFVATSDPASCVPQSGGQPLLAGDMVREAPWGRFLCGRLWAACTVSGARAPVDESAIVRRAQQFAVAFALAKCCFHLSRWPTCGARHSAPDLPPPFTCLKPGARRIRVARRGGATSGRFFAGDRAATKKVSSTWRAEAGSGGRGPARRGRERRPRPASAAGAGQTASATLPASKGATPPSSRGGRVQCEAADGDCGWDCARPPALRRATLCMRAPTVPHNCDTAKVWTRVREHVLQGVGHKGM